MTDSLPAIGGKLLSVRRSDTAAAVLLEIHNGTTPVFHIHITAGGWRVVFASNHPGFSFQTPLGVSGAPVAMKLTDLGPFTGDFSDPPTQSEIRALRDWANGFFPATARQ